METAEMNSPLTSFVFYVYASFYFNMKKMYVQLIAKNDIGHLVRIYQTKTILSNKIIIIKLPSIKKGQVHLKYGTLLTAPMIMI